MLGIEQEVEKELREWQQECLTGYCQECSDTCCNSRKHRIYLDPFSVALFQEHGIPVVKTSQLDKFFLRGNRLVLRNGSPVQQPSIIELNKLLFKPRWYLYSDFCPLYEKGKGCKVHEDQRRPSDCKDYPIHFIGYNDAREKFEVRITETCEFFRKPENRTALTERFPIAIVD